MARGIIDGVYDQGIADGQLIFTTYDELIKGIDAKRLEFFAQHLQTTIQGLQTEFDQGSARMNSVVAMIGMAYEHLFNGLKANMKASEDGLVEGMTKTINQDLKATICSQAETAAEEVQPWWKSVLKVLLVILVIVIVIALTIVTAGAFAAVGGAIAGAVGLGSSALAATLIAGALAGAVMGALSSVLITVGMNVINLAGTGKLTWSAAFEGALDAAIQGAIAGAIGGMAGPLVGVFSKGVGVLGKVLIEEGVEIAFDVLGAVIGDLVLHGEVKDWGNVLFSAVVARGIANGVKIVPKIKTKITGSKGGGADVNTSGTKTKTPVGAETNTPKTGTKTKANGEAGSTPKAGDNGVPGGKKNKPVSEGQQQAKKLGYPDAPEGYHWRKGANGEPTLAKNPGSKGGKMKYDPETGTFKNADAVTTPKKKMGDEADLQATKSKQTLSEQEFDLEMGAVNKRLPGRKIEMEDGGVKYTEEVALPNGHKWRRRLDGGWCRFSKKTCYSGAQNVSSAERSIKDQLDNGKNASVTVSSKEDAETLLRSLTSGPDHKGGYMDTTHEGAFSPQKEASDWLPRPSGRKTGTYHWDKHDPNAKVGDHAIEGNHLQIHTFEGKIIRIFYP
jgi:hypothetical protein